MDPIKKHCPLRLNPCGPDCEWFVRDHNPIKQGCILRIIRRHLIKIESDLKKITRPTETEEEQ